MKLYIKIKGVKYKLVKEVVEHSEDSACDFCDAEGFKKVCKKLSKYCKGQNHFFVKIPKKEKIKS